MCTAKLCLQLHDLMGLGLQVCLQLGGLEAPLTELAVGTIALIVSRGLLHLPLLQLDSQRLSLLMGSSCLQKKAVSLGPGAMHCCRRSASRQQLPAPRFAHQACHSWP